MSLNAYVSVRPFFSSQSLSLLSCTYVCLYAVVACVESKASECCHLFCIGHVGSREMYRERREKKRGGDFRRQAQETERKLLHSFKDRQTNTSQGVIW